ncbi:DUF2238 domain-containing protein [Moraxella nasicaprae]|uniref:DUF2238 domain-containing protein n=1 Tax=Moraxella nasicaprae TaxID=2904122 RepID=A0ABY6F3K0_9GAMM|nr:DUF2238 domain-containing protein [Moraxella nasicaprae]UXZ04672.1 DUF2238 domain-containing protein [Moraxella nasicaprae]
MPKPLITSLSVLLLAITIASIKPLYWQSYLLHQMGTLILMIPMAYLFVKHKISTTSLYAMTAFLLLHIFGAVWSYSYVPYDEWSMAIFGISISDTFNFKRNMYDRMVHFGYGLLLYPLIYDVIKRHFYQNTHRQFVFIALLINMASSLMYEWFEWGLTLVLSQNDAENYNGQQGDMWDAHKDMALAFVGAIITSTVYPKKS